MERLHVDWSWHWSIIQQPFMLVWRTTLTGLRYIIYIVFISREYDLNLLYQSRSVYARTGCGCKSKVVGFPKLRLNNLASRNNICKDVVHTTRITPIIALLNRGIYKAMYSVCML